MCFEHCTHVPYGTEHFILGSFSICLAMHCAMNLNEEERKETETIYF